MDSSPHAFRIHLEPEPEGGFTGTVPSLPLGTLRAILRQIQMTTEDFIKLL